MPFGNLPSYFCQWDFTNTNGTTVIVANINVSVDTINCHEDYLITVKDGRCLSCIFVLLLQTTHEYLHYLEENILDLNYCPVSNKTNDKYIVISPLPLNTLMVRFCF